MRLTKDNDEVDTKQWVKVTLNASTNLTRNGGNVVIWILMNCSLMRLHQHNYSLTMTCFLSQEGYAEFKKQEVTKLLLQM